jgi:hypothetical protein
MKYMSMRNTTNIAFIKFHLVINYNIMTGHVIKVEASLGPFYAGNDVAWTCKLHQVRTPFR